jgi:serine/threonine protein kinase
MLGPIVGTGAYSKVRKVYCRKTRDVYALKIIDISSLNKGDIENVQNEIKIHSQLDSPYVVKLFDYFIQRDTLYMVLEYIPKGNLYKFMQKHIFFDQAKTLDFWFNIVKGVEYLHSQRVYVRDIKPENVLIDKDLSIKLCDFGWACYLRNFKHRKLVGGTFVYMSPENLNGKLQGLSSDIWSLGVLLYELLHRKPPFKMAINSKKQLKYIEETKIKFRSNLDEEIKDLIKELLQKEPIKRPSAMILTYSKALKDVRKRFEEKSKSYLI